MIQIIPLKDLKEHEELSTCECCPSVEFENGEMLIIHNSFDGREFKNKIKMGKVKYGILVDAEKKYPVTYTIKQDGTKVIEDTFLLGKDMTENQIKELYDKGYFSLTNTKTEIR